MTDAHRATVSLSAVTSSSRPRVLAHPSLVVAALRPSLRRCIIASLRLCPSEGTSERRCVVALLRRCVVASVSVVASLCHCFRCVVASLRSHVRTSARPLSLAYLRHRVCLLSSFAPCCMVSVIGVPCAAFRVLRVPCSIPLSVHALRPCAGF